MIQNRRKSRRSAAKHMPEISLTPLIDTALVLLVIFMVATPIMKNSLNIDLPKGHMKDEQTATSSCIVAIDARERLRLNDESVSLEVLLEKLSKQAKQSKDGKVYIHCDQKAASGTLVQVIDAIKYVAGVEHVVLSTDRA